MIRNISRGELKDKMDRGEEFFLVEALDERFYRHSHLPGAINLPPKALDRSLNEVRGGRPWAGGQGVRERA
jgi:hypothetical protein